MCLLVFFIIIIIWGSATKWRFIKSKRKDTYDQKKELPYFYGEFGAELGRVIPHAYALYKQNRLKSIECLKSMKAFYKVFPSNLVKYKNSGKRADSISVNWFKYIGSKNHSYPIPFDWEPPQYTGLYKNIPIIFSSDL